jgi:hypothetical protein
MVNLERKRKLRQLLLAVLLPWVVLLIFRVGVLCTDGETDPDAFYHAKLAEQGPSVFLAKKFPALTMSIWKDHFSNKEMGFHFILWGLHRVGSAVGLKTSCPFHYYTMFCLALLLTVIAVTLIRWNIVCPWYYTLLFAGVYYAFTTRLVFLRAYLLSMSLFVLVICLLSAEELRNSKWRLAWLFIIGVLFSWCYSNPHFILFPTVAFAIAEFLADRNWRRLPILPSVALLGVITGLCLHPQFPNTWLILKVQCWDVLKMIMGSGAEAKIRGGNEFYFNSVYSLIRAPFWAGLPFFLAFLIWRWRKYWFQPCWRQRVNFNALLILFVSSFVAFLFFFRFIEYAMPSAVLLTALVAQGCAQAGKEEGGSQLFASCHLIGLYVICSYMLTVPSLLAITGNNHRPYTGIAEWAQRKGLPAGTIIANPRWGAFPMLYYAMPQYRYFNGLDPMFAYAYDAEKALIVEEMRTVSNILPPGKFRELTGAEYLHVSADSKALAEAVLRKGYTLVYYGWDGWMFEMTGGRGQGEG